MHDSPLTPDASGAPCGGSAPAFNASASDAPPSGAPRSGGSGVHAPAFNPPLSQAAGGTSSVRGGAHKVTVTAMLSAVAFLLMFIEFPIPALIPSFIKMDVSDLPELLAAFALGPGYGAAVALVKNLLHILFKGTSSAYVGELCNFTLGAVFALTAGYLYRWKKTRTGALLGSLAGAALMALVSVPLNFFVVYPAYVVFYHLPLEAIIGMYQAILPSADSLIKCLAIFNLPFTFVKGMLDVGLCFLIYKPLSPILHK